MCLIRFSSSEIYNLFYPPVVFRAPLKNVVTLLQIFQMQGYNKLLPKKRRNKRFTPLLFLFYSGALFAQDSLSLPSVNISATRLALPVLKAPMSISKVERSWIAVGQPQVTLQEALAIVPGVVATNADNFAQDLRVSIRGFGARSAFGIRGIRLMVDGLPETTTDGQGQVDNIDPGSLASLEVLRGAAAGAYGNASGGVLQLTTAAATKPFEAGIRSMAGSFGLQQHRLQIGVARDHLNVYATASQTRINGFRAQSASRSTVVNTKIAWQPNSKALYTLLVNYADAPRADDPGALTLTEAQSDPRLARPQNITFQGGEALSQGRIGVTTRHELTPNQTLEGRAFYLFRRFDSRLPLRPSGIVTFDRTFAGGGLVWSHRHYISQYPARIRVQAEWETQSDDRTRFDNLNGTRGNLVTDQRESFTSLGSGVLYDWQPGNWTLLGGLRYDGFGLQLRDRFLKDGDDSGTRRYDVVNPLFGITYSASLLLNVYANIATAFETPTLNELANPTGFGGFNPVLNPQRSVSMETGIKGAKNGQWRYELALFTIQTDSELVPYEEVSQPGRTFFRNAGSTRRRGVEVSTDWCLYRHLWLTGTYTFSHFRYKVAPDVRNNGNALPGLAPHNGLIAMRWLPESGFFGVVQTQYTDQLYADDANMVTINPVWLASARGGYIHRFKRNIRLEVFAGLQNMSNTRYFSNIRINAVGGRYYEPGPNRGWYAGLGLSF